MRSTSLEAYRAIRDSGQLGRLYKRAYHLLWMHGPLAQHDMGRFEARKDTGFSLAKAFAPMERAGLIRVVDSKDHPQSGYRCNVYDVTAHVPTEHDLAKVKVCGDTLSIRHLARLFRQPTGKGMVEGSGTDWGMRLASVTMAANEELQQRLNEAWRIARGTEPEA